MISNEDKKKIDNFNKCIVSLALEVPGVVYDDVRKIVTEVLLIIDRQHNELARHEQIGWYDPGSKRFCYIDEKEAWPESRKGYNEPVFVKHAKP